MSEIDPEWTSLLKGGTEAIRDAAQLLESAQISPRVTPIPGG